MTLIKGIRGCGLPAAEPRALFIAAAVVNSCHFVAEPELLIYIPM
jgi:hypothetical protein